MTVRGGGVPMCFLGLHAEGENGSAASELPADAHDCIMVRVIGPTEYKVVARWPAPVAWLRSDRWLVVVYKVDPAAGGWTGNAPRQGSRLRAPASRLTALTRPRSQSVSLAIASALCADARPKSKKERRTRRA